jgi:3-oxoacyl-[acyl-carrier protein] reductase
MDLQLTGKRALVTGSTAGIGEGITKMLALEGCRVVVHGRDRARADRIRAEIGNGATIAIGDISTEAGANAVAEAAGEIDILVNNSGPVVTPGKRWDEIDDVAWIEAYQQNAVAAARMIRRFLPGMKKRAWGRIINIASTGANQPMKLQPNFYASKAAMLNMTVSLAKELGDCGVTANTVSPGPVFTRMSAEVVEKARSEFGWSNLSSEEAAQRIIGTLNIPLNRWGQIEEIAYVICMIASPRSSYVMGANIRVDGGDVQSMN